MIAFLEGFYEDMELPAADDHIERFVYELLGTGSMLFDLVADLSEAVPPEAYPGEEPAAVVLEMLCGTIATAVGSAEPDEIRRATALIIEAGARALEHLRLACELSRRMRDPDAIGKIFG